jgi:glycosyltransferase involved in cell wall biosynthesis
MKLFGYLAAGRPILAPVSPDTAELLEQEENALLVEPDRPEIAAAALDRLLGDAALAERLGANAHRLAQGLSWDSRADRIVAFLQARLAQRPLQAGTAIPAGPAMAGPAQASAAAGN